MQVHKCEENKGPASADSPTSSLNLKGQEREYTFKNTQRLRGQSARSDSPMALRASVLKGQTGIFISKYSISKCSCARTKGYYKISYFEEEYREGGRSTIYIHMSLGLHLTFFATYPVPTENGLQIHNPEPR